MTIRDDAFGGTGSRAFDRHRSRLSTILFSSTVGVLLCSAACAAPDGGTPAGATDACADIAAAKFKEWLQPKVMVQETRTLGDGSLTRNELILTNNVAYATDSSGAWVSVQVTVRDRTPQSPQAVERHMGLASCAVAGHVQEAGEAATMYTYTYTPETDGSVTEGAAWISDATGLPLRQHLKENGELANRRVARVIDATYSYNFELPRAAELAQLERQRQTQEAVREFQGLFQNAPAKSR
jgi:hypothetical protein